MSIIRCRQYQTAAMSDFHVCVVYNSDAQLWPKYITDQAKSAFGSDDFRSCTVPDTELSRPDSVAKLKASHVVVVVVSHGHLDRLDYLSRCAMNTEH